MITVYRAADVEYKPDLSGFGASKFNGRWHRKFRTEGNQIIQTKMLYTSEHADTTLLEKLAHSGTVVLPRYLNILTITGLLAENIEQIAMEDLPEDWSQAQNFTQDYGMAWLISQRSLALRVPSKVGYHTHNVLINPQHKNFSKLHFEYERYETDIRFQGS